MAGSLQQLLTPYVAATFPKQITIHNIWVGLLFWGLRVASLVWCAYGLWSIRAHTSQVFPLNSSAFWSQSSPRYAQAQRADMQSAHCSEPDQFQYQYDDEAEFRYVDLGCTHLTAERWFKGESELFFPTFVQENMTQVHAVNGSDCSQSCTMNMTCASGDVMATGDRNELGLCLCQCTSSRNRFITAVEENMVSWEHSVIAEERSAWVTKTHTASSGTPADNLKTILKREDGTIVKSFAPGEVLTLSLRELFEAAYPRISLNDYLDNTRRNVMVDDRIKPFPLLRMSGVRLEVVQNYYNQEDSRHPSDHDGPVCVVTVNSVKEWCSKPRLDFMEVSSIGTGTGKFRYRYFYGVRMTFRATGSYSFFDPERIFSIIATIVVYLSMPTSVTMFIVNNLLGTLSTIYSNATYEIVDAPTLLKGVLTRALTAHQAYRAFWRGGARSLQPDTEQFISLEPATSESDSEEEAVCKHRVEAPHESILIARLRTLFKVAEVDGKLDDGELATIKLLLTGSLDPHTRISEKQFIEYHLSADSADLATVADVFDVDRRRHILERLFDTDVPTKRKLHRAYSNCSPASVHPDRDLS
eukprot:TRINITY_DN33297_c0_g1_i1.p1 TRINITY_DN33297_c0_g1~~TRINITY_DN33297_c0_g1_i1.p1  ORF type:complete len:585 (+),score=42.79 TRINITY_DN33297_c0_g1_i1:21-1775(+)